MKTLLSRFFAFLIVLLAEPAIDGFVQQFGHGLIPLTSDFFEGGFPL